jgi:hypothetical protein
MNGLVPIRIISGAYLVAPQVHVVCSVPTGRPQLAHENCVNNGIQNSTNILVCVRLSTMSKGKEVVSGRERRRRLIYAKMNLGEGTKDQVNLLYLFEGWPAYL